MAKTKSIAGSVGGGDGGNACPPPTPGHPDNPPPGCGHVRGDGTCQDGIDNDADGLADRIYDYARPYLRSRDVEVVVNLEGMRGWITCGWNNGGSFTIERLGGQEARDR